MGPEVCCLLDALIATWTIVDLSSAGRAGVTQKGLHSRAGFFSSGMRDEGLGMTGIAFRQTSYR